MQIKLQIIISIFLFSLAQNVLADRYVLRHLCFKPEKPLFMASFFQHELYKKDVENYKDCIDKYIKVQKRAVTAHENAMQEAADDLKKFDKYNK
ncbi:MAG: hypothetical protein HQL46_12160 [Gammaproteobacteria bacterium]|nr:hypothetical protein [Gammaproteobacteria bacterium]